MFTGSVPEKQSKSLDLIPEGLAACISVHARISGKAVLRAGAVLPHHGSLQLFCGPVVGLSPFCTHAEQGLALSREEMASLPEDCARTVSVVPKPAIHEKVIQSCAQAVSANDTRILVKYRCASIVSEGRGLSF